MKKSIALLAFGMICAASAASAAPISAEDARREESGSYWMKNGPLPVFSGKVVAKPYYCSPGSRPETRIGERNDKYFGMGYFANHGAKGKK